MLLYDETPAAVRAREDAFLVRTGPRVPFHPREGRGARLYDDAGRPYWDLLGGMAVNVLGYRHPRLIAALREAGGALLHVSNVHYHPAHGILAEKLVRASGLDRAFFCNSGVEATEAALRLARLATKRPGLVGLEKSGRDPFVPGVTFVPPNDVEALEAAVGGDTAAILLEPVVSDGGILPLDDDYLIAARRIADRHGALLVFDESECGLGRTGYLFAFQKSGVLPDLLILANALGGGLPLGAVLTGAAVEGVVKPGQHGLTFGGNPVACRLGAVVLDETRKILPKIREIEHWLGDELCRLPHVRAVRGAGLLWEIELDRPAAPVAAALLDRGFVVGTGGGHALRLMPPYIVPKRALSELVETLGLVLGAPVAAAA